MTDGISPGLAEFLDRLSVEDRENLLSVLRDSRTYIAEDMTDVLAILQDLDI
jgi:hypothetical protein